MILEFRDVTLRRGRNTVLRDITFRQPDNVSIGVMGGLGSGKTSLIDLAIGMLPPSRGRIRRRGRISMPIGSNATVNPLFSGEEITRQTAGFFGVEPRSLCRFVDDFAELGPAFRKPFRQFNSAQKGRFLFALSYGVPADCYVSDGPLIGGDPGFRQKCLGLALARRERSGFLFATQSPSDMRLFADVGAVLFKGRLVFCSGIEETIAAFTELYGKDAIRDTGESARMLAGAQAAEAPGAED